LSFLLFPYVPTAGHPSFPIKPVRSAVTTAAARSSKKPKNKREAKVKIAVDAMGGDFGPQITVPGAFRLARDIVANRVQEKISEEIAKAALTTDEARA
jgi:hypothetical protein